MTEDTTRCTCGQEPIGPVGVCSSCETDLRELLMPSNKDGVLRQIAAIAEGSTTANSLPNIARMARHGLTLKG